MTRQVNFDLPAASTSMETYDSNQILTSNAEEEDLDSSVTFSPRNMFQGSPKHIETNNNETGTTDTSTEFQKLMQPFHSVLQLNDSQSEANSIDQINNVAGMKS